MGRVIHFEIHADDLDRAASFYRDALGWTIRPAEGLADLEHLLVATGAEGTPGIDGGIVRRPGPPPGDDPPIAAFVCTAEVASLDDTLAAIHEAGGAVLVPRTAVPGVGWLAYGRDTEGNAFGVMEPDPAAA